LRRELAEIINSNKIGITLKMEKIEDCKYNTNLVFTYYAAPVLSEMGFAFLSILSEITYLETNIAVKFVIN
jgi:hypothetical protein